MIERLDFDLSLIGDYDFILGIDEVGWGCVAGSLVLGGALVPKQNLENNSFEWFKDVKDSKKLSDKKRTALLEKIKYQSNILTVVGEASVDIINEKGLAYAYTICIEQILSYFKDYLPSCKILIDGNRDPKTNIIKSFELIIKGDDKSLSIGIASNIAKQYRDDLMVEISKIYPYYDLENNVGYGTSKHIQGLTEHGLSPIHRKKASEKLINK